MRAKFFPLAALIAASPAWGQSEFMQQCLLNAIQSAADSVTAGELREVCQAREVAEQEVASEVDMDQLVTEVTGAEGGMSKRMALQRYSRDNPFALTPHRPNYLLPAVIVKDPNEDAADSNRRDLDNMEVQFQLSLEVVVWEDILGTNSHLSVAYTNRSFWQAYNEDLSAAFRETNHEPELILTIENDWELFGFTNVANQIIFNHQSNGQDVPHSRSWNRLMVNFMFERDDFLFSFMPWYRLEEDEKSGPLDPDGDDNPDMERYMGHFQWLGSWQYRNNNFSLMLRNNLRSENKGAAELSWSFPIGGRFKGYIKYFNGYGESLIDYDARTESLGVGVLLTEWF